jgi:hypothetical protein
MKSMRAIFYALGPDFRPDSKVPPFENIDVYPLVAKILGLKTGPTDGGLAPLEQIFGRPQHSDRAGQSS